MAGNVRLIRSPISVAGMVLTTISAVLFLVVFLADVLGLHTNPYIGIVFFLVLPGLFVITRAGRGECTMRATCHASPATRFTVRVCGGAKTASVVETCATCHKTEVAKTQ